MKKSNFLIKLKKQGRLKIVEPSQEICDSYPYLPHFFALIELLFT